MIKAAPFPKGRLKDVHEKAILDFLQKGEHQKIMLSLKDRKRLYYGKSLYYLFQKFVD